MARLKTFLKEKVVNLLSKLSCLVLSVALLSGSVYGAEQASLPIAAPELAGPVDGSSVGATKGYLSNYYYYEAYTFYYYAYANAYYYLYYGNSSSANYYYSTYMGYANYYYNLYLYYR